MSRRYPGWISPRSGSGPVTATGRRRVARALRRGGRQDGRRGFFSGSMVDTILSVFAAFFIHLGGRCGARSPRSRDVGCEDGGGKGNGGESGDDGGHDLFRVYLDKNRTAALGRVRGCISQIDPPERGKRPIHAITFQTHPASQETSVTFCGRLIKSDGWMITTELPAGVDFCLCCHRAINAIC